MYTGSSTNTLSILCRGATSRTTLLTIATGLAAPAATSSTWSYILTGQTSGSQTSPIIEELTWSIWLNSSFGWTDKMYDLKPSDNIVSKVKLSIVQSNKKSNFQAPSLPPQANKQIRVNHIISIYIKSYTWDVKNNNQRRSSWEVPIYEQHRRVKNRRVRHCGVNACQSNAA